jgi:hypothetical protein
MLQIVPEFRTEPRGFLLDVRATEVFRRLKRVLCFRIRNRRYDMLITHVSVLTVLTVLPTRVSSNNNRTNT